MLTKVLTTLMLTGALVVAGDATYQRVGCCFPGADCCPFSSCCFGVAQQKSNCCSTQSTRSDCCAAPSRSTAQSSCCAQEKNCCSATTTSPCCDAAFVYCTRTGEIYLGCCCEIVNGQYRCLITGAVSDECCCIPLD